VAKKVNPLCGLDPYDATALIEQVRVVFVSLYIWPSGDFVCTTLYAVEEPFISPHPCPIVRLIAQGVRPAYSSEHPGLVMELVDAAWDTDPKCVIHSQPSPLSLLSLSPLSLLWDTDPKCVPPLSSLPPLPLLSPLSLLFLSLAAWDTDPKCVIHLQPSHMCLDTGDLPNNVLLLLMLFVVFLLIIWTLLFYHHLSVSFIRYRPSMFTVMEVLEGLFDARTGTPADTFSVLVYR